MKLEEFNKRMDRAINTNHFFETMDKAGRKSFKAMYENYLTYTIDDINIKTGEKYTDTELEKLHAFAIKNLKNIELAHKTHPNK